MFWHKFTIAGISASLLLMLPANVSAATFTDGEIAQVQHFQKEYTHLSKTKYDINNLYQQKPNLTEDFSAGKLKPQYIQDQTDYINYYRSLFGLFPISTTSIANENAQITAAVMAAINANPFIDQHGLRGDSKPKFIKDTTWKIAQDTSETSNLNFNTANQSAGDVITDLLTDRYNLSGTDTGHRAWLLSTRISSTGIGAAYGNNGYRYSVQKVLNVDDLFKVASKSVVTYPSAGVFPIELAKGKNIAWSIYFSNKTYTGTPAITIKDLDTGKAYAASNVKNYSSSGFGDFKSVITYLPNKVPLVEGHEYQVTIGNLSKYNFKLFKQDSTTSLDTTKQSDSVQAKSVQQDTKVRSPFLKVNSKLWASWTSATKPISKYDFFEFLNSKHWKNRRFFHQYIIGRY